MPLNSSVRRLCQLTLVTVWSCAVTGSAAAASLSEILAKMPIPVGTLIPDLLTRSTTAIEAVHHERSCSDRRADFDGIRHLAGEVAWRADTAYDEPQQGESIMQLSGTVRGRWGFFATKTETSLQGYALPDDFPRPSSWNETKPNPVTIISFRGTDDLFDWWANYTQARRGWTPDQYRFALQISAAALAAIPDDHLVIFAGHSLGGSLATYVALAAYYGQTEYFAGGARPTVGAITFNSAGLHPANFADVVPDMNRLYPGDITNIHHFFAYSADAKVDAVGAFSFAGYALLPGAKYLVDRTDSILGNWPSTAAITDLHDMQKLRTLITRHTGGQTMSCLHLQGRDIYVHGATAASGQISKFSECNYFKIPPPMISSRLDGFVNGVTSLITRSPELQRAIGDGQDITEAVYADGLLQRVAGCMHSDAGPNVQVLGGNATPDHAGRQGANGFTVIVRALPYRHCLELHKRPRGNPSYQVRGEPPGQAPWPFGKCVSNPVLTVFTLGKTLPLPNTAYIYKPL